MLGNAMAPIALAFAVLDLTGSKSDLGFVLAARSLQLVIFLLVGGDLGRPAAAPSRDGRLEPASPARARPTLAALLLTG